MDRLPRRLALAVLGVLTLGALLMLGAGSAGAKGGNGRPADKVVMFASDGMRPDLMEKYAKAGAMPTYKKLMKDGATGDNGMLQAFPPNTGVGWYTMATGTYPSEHGSTNNTFFRSGRRVLQPDLVLGGRRAAGGHDRQRRRAGRQEGRADRLGRRRRREHQRPDGRLHELLLQPRRARRRRRPGRAGRLGLLRRHLQVADRRPGVRAGPASRPATRRRRRRRRRGRSTRRFAAQNPNRTYNVYFYDSVTGGGAKLRPRDRQPGRQDGRGAVRRPQGRRLPAAQADRRRTA